MQSEDLLQRVESALNTVRPYLEADGGNVKVIEVTADMVVRVEMMGACGACSMSTFTLKAGIEDAIKRLVPEIVAVEAINVSALA